LVLLPATGREKRRQTLEEVITKGQSLLPTKINDDHGKPSR
jgi:hypothetical protein